MSKEWLKYVAYGVIVGKMARKIWKRSHEESRISLRPEFMPDSSEQVQPPLPPEFSYQDIRPVGYAYAIRPVYRSTEDMKNAVAGYSMLAKAKPTVASSPSRSYFNGRTYSSISEMLQAMEIHALEGWPQAEQNNHVTIVTRNN
jgi:hypothetical protein